MEKKCYLRVPAGSVGEDATDMLLSIKYNDSIFYPRQDIKIILISYYFLDMI